jgi:SNF2 family DNA or RNA helicase
VLYDDVLFDYQKEASKRIAEQRRILLADQPGLGKTLEVLAGLELAGLLSKPSNILILTPIINAQTTWRDSIERFVMPRYEVNIIDISKGTSAQKTKAMTQTTDGVNIVIANHNAIDRPKEELRVPNVVDIDYDAVIIDESHMVLPIKNPRSMTNFWRGLKRIPYNDNAMRIAISGTPDRGKLDNRYGTWVFLDPWNTEISKWDWLEKNFVIYEQKVARHRTVKMVGALRSRTTWTEKDRKMMIRRTKQEVLPQLPPKRYVDVELELNKQQQVAYKLKEEDTKRKVFDAKIEERDNSEAMVFAIRARQLATCSWQEADGTMIPLFGGESSKLDWLLEWLDERGFIEHDDMVDNQAKVVIVSQFSMVLHWLKHELAQRDIKAMILDGSTPSAQRDEIQRVFQEKTSPLRIVLLSGSMGVGITLDAADDLIMLDSPYDPDRVEQIEDRVHRASNMHHVTIWNLIAKNTIDQAIAERVSQRYKTTRQLMDGSRGVDFGRKIIDLIRKGDDDNTDKV